MTLALTRAPRPAAGLFPTYLAAGFECSTPVNFHGERLDELVTTGHDDSIIEDYTRLRQLGIRTVRDGVRWNVADRSGQLDFSTALPYVDAATREGLTVIWDLFHYGYPEDLDPFDPRPFIARFAAYCGQFAQFLQKRQPGARTRFYAPVNEISFFAWAGGEVGMFAPHARGRGPELKSILALAAIRAMDAIRAVDPAARFVHCDPVVRVVAPAEAPWLQEEADYFNANFVTEAWDMLSGKVMPELGGHPRYLDILGVNYYGVNQWEHGRPENVLPDDDPRRVPFSDLLIDLHHRYRRPMMVAETSSTGPDRAIWLRRIAQQCERAMEHGVELHALCVYPVLGMTDWETGCFRPMGLWDSTDSRPLLRIGHRPTLRLISELQRRYGQTAPASGICERRVAVELSA